MNKYFDNHFQKNVVTIYPGEYYSTKDDEMISTVLGSCVSIVLYDEKNNVGGINHFMLARDSKGELEDSQTDKKLGKFGEYAIDLLIEDIKKKGGVFENFEAKVFGGGNIFNLPDIDSQVGNVNSKFAFEYLKKLGIPVVKSDTGGNYPRKIYFDPSTRKVYMKYIINNHSNEEDSKQSVKKKDYIDFLQEKEKELETEIKNKVRASMKIELKTVKNLFEEDD